MLDFVRSCRVYFESWNITPERKHSYKPCYCRVLCF
nr:MAG TPA: hypothetical protein [Caudoviricetes sp.]